MPTAQRSQCRYFAYQLWGEREREREKGDRQFRFTEKQEHGVVAERNTPAFTVFPLTL